MNYALLHLDFYNGNTDIPPVTRNIIYFNILAKNHSLVSDVFVKIFFLHSYWKQRFGTVLVWMCITKARYWKFNPSATGLGAGAKGEVRSWEQSLHKWINGLLLEWVPYLESGLVIKSSLAFPYSLLPMWCLLPCYDVTGRPSSDMAPWSWTKSQTHFSSL